MRADSAPPRATRAWVSALQLRAWAKELGMTQDSRWGWLGSRASGEGRGQKPGGVGALDVLPVVT